MMIERSKYLRNQRNCSLPRHHIAVTGVFSRAMRCEDIVTARLAGVDVAQEEGRSERHRLEHGIESLIGKNCFNVHSALRKDQSAASGVAEYVDQERRKSQSSF